MIHSTAIVSKKAKIGKNVTIGAYTIVEDDVVIGNNCEIAHNCTLADGLRMGNDVKIFPNACLATIPQDLKFHGEETTLEIGDRTVIREFTHLNRGTEDRWKTVIGADCLIMAYVHVAHDAIIGSKSIIGNGTQVAGHVTIGYHATISAHVLIHQFGKIGDYVMIEGGAKVKKDVPPFVMAAGEPLKYSGLNKIRLKWCDFSDEDIQIISDAFRIIYRSKLNPSQAIKKLETEFEHTEHTKNILNFLKNSERGILV